VLEILRLLEVVLRGMDSQFSIAGFKSKEEAQLDSSMFGME
jgi:hypothetical protein